LLILLSQGIVVGQELIQLWFELVSDNVFVQGDLIVMAFETHHDLVVHLVQVAGH